MAASVFTRKADGAPSHRAVVGNNTLT